MIQAMWRPAVAALALVTGAAQAQIAVVDEVATRQRFLEALLTNDLATARTMLERHAKIVVHDDLRGDPLQRLRAQLTHCKLTQIVGVSTAYARNSSSLFCDNDLPAGLFWQIEAGRIRRIEFGYLGPAMIPR